jgi:putative ABC transport system permease protein
MITYKMAKLLNVDVGDEISWHIYGYEKWITSKVGAINRNPFNQGVTLSKECFEQFGFEFKPTAILTNAEVPDNVEGVNRVRSQKMLMQNLEILMEVMNLLVFLLVIAAITLAAVVIYNLGVLSFTERQRELSTLKVIGFKTRKLRSLLLMQNIWLTAVGIIPGIPIGIWILNYMCNFMGDVFDFMITISAVSYLLCIAGTILVSALVNRLFSKRVKRIDMVSSLKGVE